ncbi:MAG: hypothetical protein A2Z34_10770 [Planctomycetes bacterium RBG_16_59_8]|nr:MAG: hypothetical protein A2Z34_10770 [Planctomycetes bacterium RBG_16_59_8]
MFGLNEKQLLIVTIVAICIVMAAGGAAVYYFQFVVLEEKKAKIKEIETKTTAAQKQIEEMDRFKTETEEFNKKIESVRSVIPSLSTEEYDKFVNMIQSIRNQCGVEIGAARLTLTNKKNPVGGALPVSMVRVDYQLTATGRFYNVIRFLNAIETHNRFMHIQTFAITPAKAGLDSFNLPVTISTYLFKPGTPGAATAAPQEPPLLPPTTPIP